MKSKEFLEYEHHKYLRGLRERTDQEWVKRNEELKEKTLAGEDEAFFQLLERNPEFLKTDLAIAKIIQWQYAIRYLGPFDRATKTFQTSRPELDRIQKRIANARKNLLKIGKILAFEEGKDRRGKKKGPPLFDIYYAYRGLLSLFRGIKNRWKIKKKTEKENVYRYLLRFIEEFEEKKSDRYGPVCDAIDAFRSAYGLNQKTIQSIVYKSEPTDFAREVTGKILGINEDTVRQALRKFTRGGRDDIFDYYDYSRVFLGNEEQVLWFDFLIPMLEFENPKGIDID